MEKRKTIEFTLTACSHICIKAQIWNQWNLFYFCTWLFFSYLCKWEATRRTRTHFWGFVPFLFLTKMKLNLKFKECFAEGEENLFHLPSQCSFNFAFMHSSFFSERNENVLVEKRIIDPLNFATLYGFLKVSIPQICVCFLRDFCYLKEDYRFNTVYWNYIHWTTLSNESKVTAKNVLGLISSFLLFFLYLIPSFFNRWFVKIKLERQIIMLSKKRFSSILKKLG